MERLYMFVHVSFTAQQNSFIFFKEWQRVFTGGARAQDEFSNSHATKLLLNGQIEQEKNTVVDLSIFFVILVYLTTYIYIKQGKTRQMSLRSLLILEKKNHSKKMVIYI